MPTASINGVDLYYERHGERGEPLVLVHGYTGDITDWRYQVPEFSRTHRLLVFDLRGHGRSQAPRDRAAYGILQMAGDAEALAAHAGFSRYHLLGHSMGGAIVQEIALRSPGRLLSLTLEDTSFRFGLPRDGAIAQWIAQRHRMADEQGMAAVADFPGVLPPPPHMPPERLDETKQRLARMSVDAFIGAWQALDAWPGTEDRLAGISAPTLVICGDLDVALVGPSKTLAASIPGATLEIIPECGHSPQYERPELFNAALRRHLDRNTGPNYVIAGDACGSINPFNDEMVESAYGDYCRIARAFVRLINRPEVMRGLTGTGMRSATIMGWVMRIMANLLRPDTLGPAEAAVRNAEAAARGVDALVALKKTWRP